MAVSSLLGHTLGRHCVSICLQTDYESADYDLRMRAFRACDLHRFACMRMLDMSYECISRILIPNNAH
jgi:hypothetical protein